MTYCIILIVISRGRYLNSIRKISGIRITENISRGIIYPLNCLEMRGENSSDE